MKTTLLLAMMNQEAKMEKRSDNATAFFLQYASSSGCGGAGTSRTIDSQCSRNFGQSTTMTRQKVIGMTSMFLRFILILGCVGSSPCFASMDGIAGRSSHHIFHEITRRIKTTYHSHNNHGNNVYVNAVSGIIIVNTILT